MAEHQVCCGGSVRKEVPSSRSNEVYTVEVHPDKASCTCKGWTFHGKCKHVEQARTELCTWDSSVGPEKQTHQQMVFMLCPRCNGDTRHG